MLTLLLGLAAQGVAGPPVNPGETVNAYVAAYNDRDIDAMVALMHDDIEWLAVEGGQVSAMARGKADLVAQLREYVASPAATTSTLSDSVINGRFIAVTETASWISPDGDTRSQAALAVYELEDDLIRRVWYYPAQ